MGTWGVAIFSDDLAADLRADLTELIGEGLSVSEATDRLMTEYASSLNDPDEKTVFWIALASAQWKLGRLEERTKQTALQIMDDGSDLIRWQNPKDRARRAEVLEKARAELLSAQPPAKRIPRSIKEANDWQIGEIIGFRLSSEKWTLLRVIDHHVDKGGRFAICELLDWVGDQFPPQAVIAQLPIRKETVPGGVSQFLFQQPRKKSDQSRVVKIGVTTSPSQTAGGFTAVVWPHVDQQLASLFGLH